MMKIRKQNTQKSETGTKMRLFEANITEAKYFYVTPRNEVKTPLATDKTP